MVEITREDVQRLLGEGAHNAGWDLCVVADDEGVVLGLLDVTALGGDPAAVVEDMLRSAPTTYRPHVTVEETARRAAESRSGGRAVSG